MSGLIRRTLMFWWVLFLVIQQGERLFLLPETAARETPAAGLLLKTLATGLLEDLVVATGAITAAAVLALVCCLPFSLRGSSGSNSGRAGIYRRGLVVSSALIAGLLMMALTIDMGYYGYGGQHLNFVFFEYVVDLVESTEAGGEIVPQAAQQTSAELEDGGKWGPRLSGFLLVEGLAILAWVLAFRRGIGPALLRWELQRPLAANVLLAAALAGGVVGLSPIGLPAGSVPEIGSEAYAMLAQNPILFAAEPLRAALLSQWHWVPSRGHQAMSLEEALRLTRETLGRGAAFPYPQYPLVRESGAHEGARFDRPANVLLVFVEGLDRRYLGRTIVSDARAQEARGGDRSAAPAGRSIRLTPFLDAFKGESLYVESFFANGVQTSRGLFATLCAYYPRQGTAVIKTRSAQDYLCLPSLLHKAGYRSEMVLSEASDLRGLRPFMSRNGLDRLYTEADFPAGAERLGARATDAALFEFLRARIEALQAGAQPFFVTTLTSGTHHPFTVPHRHPDVRALQREPDPYVAALRYFDLEFERFFTELRRDGLLANTIVLVLGDHGRHEPVGETSLEQEVGHFMAPLFIWLDESLRSPRTFRPRTVGGVASQVDLAPTLLALNGLTPRVSPFLGRDISCILVADCLRGNLAFLSSVYDDLIGLVDQDGLWLYSFRRGSFFRVDPTLRDRTQPLAIRNPETVPQYRRLQALYLATNALLEQNAVWSWSELGGRL